MGSIEILIADDHELFRRTVRSFIETQPNYHVCGEAGDGIEAIEKVRLLHPDVVLMDINMPRMDGLEATRIIRREIPDCKVIIVTQNHPTIARAQARSVDAADSVTKSDLTRDLRPAIERVFEDTNAERKEPKDESTTAEGWVRAGGALAKLIYEFDWTGTPLGPIEKWPQSLKTVVRVMLASRFAMWMSWGPELTFLYNDAYAKMTLGKKHPWALGKPSEKVWEEIWDDIGPRIRKVLDTGEATWDEALLLFLERSGYREETYHTFSYSPLLADDDRVAGHLCVVTEETDRIIGERRLKTLRSLATELSKTITEEDVVASVSRSLQENEQDLPFTLAYLFSRDAKEARLACSTGIMPGHVAAPEVIPLTAGNQSWPLGDLLQGKDSVVVENLQERFGNLPTGAWDDPPTRALLLPITSQAQGAPAGVIVAGLNPYRPLEVSYAGFLNLVAGQIAGSIANARAYEAEKNRAEALAEIDRTKTLFFSNVSHEFRTPLTLMLAPLEDMLADSQALAPQQRERLDIAHRNSLRLLKLVNTLLDFSRIEAGRFQASYEPIDLSQLTSELASAFRSTVERAGLRFVVDCPSLDEPAYVDRELWEKIVFNILSNAFKFTFEGEIEVSTRKTDTGFELVVRDSGTGIPAGDLPHLFERFYQVKNAHGRTFEGSGIGLALVQELASQHGGLVRVESELGRGSTFTVTIPRGSAHLPADRIGAERTLASTALRGEAYVEEALHWLPEVQNAGSFASAPLMPAEEPDLHRAQERPRILLADDNLDMREYVRRLLSASCDVQAVTDGRAALEAIRTNPPDLILTDVMMPELDGFGLLKEVRSNERTSTIPVILLSARAGEESRVEGLGAGADDYLTKPFSARELLARVNAHLAMAKVRHEAAKLDRELREHAESERSRLQELFMQAPAAIGLLSGPEHRYTFVNQEYLKLTGRQKPEDFVGKTVRQALPEFEGQPFFNLLDQVYRTGIPHKGDEVKVILKRDSGDPEERYHNFGYLPVLGLTGQVESILVHVVDITKEVLARQEVARREQQVREIGDQPASVDKFLSPAGDNGNLQNKNASARPQASADCFAVDVEMAALMRSIDWSKTPVGPVEKWPQSLKTSLSILLTQKTPVFLFWGPEHVQFYNDAYRPILGTSKHPSAMGQRGQDCWREIWDIIQPLLDAVHRGESTAVTDGLLVIDRNGYLEEFYFNYTYSPIRDESGSVGGVFCVVYDTTQRVIGERRLKTLRELAGHGNQARTAEDACRLAAKTLGTNRYDVPFASLYLFDEARTKAHLAASCGFASGGPGSPEEVSLTEESALARAARVGGIQSIDLREFDLPPLPGDPWPDPPSSGVIVPIISPDKSLPDGFAFVGINARKRLDSDYETFLKLAFGHIGTAIASARAFEEEKKRSEALAEIDRAKTLFFSNVSHEFRTPLTLMLGPLEDTLASTDGLAGKQRERLELAHRNSLRLLKLVNNLLDFSRIEANRIEVSYEPVDLCELTSEFASVFRSAIERAGLRLIVTCPDLGERVYVDREMWEKIVFNLLSNALKFTLTGEIEVSVKRANGTAELAVRDTGSGIPSGDLPHLFERFYRVKGAQGRTFEGSGIGLALVQELANLHGGTVQVESELKRGSTFRVSIPLGKDHLPADRIGAPRTLASTGSRGETYVQEVLHWLPDDQDSSEATEIGSLSPPSPLEIPSSTDSGRPSRILLADDNADMRRYVQRLLQQQYEVVAVGDGQAALESARRQPPDLVLTDIMMPRLDGFGLIRELRSHEELRSIPVILLSARAGEESRLEGLDAGANDYLVKPFSARELLARVGSHLATAKIRREAAQSEQVRDLSRRLLQAQDEERRHIAREFHDSAGQTLTVLGMNLSQLYEEAEKSAPEMKKYVQGAQELVQQLHQDVRTTSYLLHPPLLDENGLAAALNWYVDGLSERSELDIKLNIAADFGRLPRDLELVVFRLIQECLTNIHRHSGSKTASIQIARGTTDIAVDVRDEGRGMSAERLAEVQSCGSGVGIRGIRERLRQFGGILNIESGSSGTRIHVTIPSPKQVIPVDRANSEPVMTG